MSDTPPSPPFPERWIARLRTLLTDASVAAPADDISAQQWAADNNIDAATQFQAMMEALDVPTVLDLANWLPNTDYLTKFNIGFSRNHGVLCMESGGHRLTAMICGWSGWNKLDLVRRRLGRDVDVARTSDDMLAAAINRCYEGQDSATQTYIDSLDSDELINSIRVGEDDLLDSSGRGPIVRMVNLILFDAVKAGASDIHIQPSGDRVDVRQRIDGVLFNAFEIPKSMQEQVLTRIKVLGRMDIAEKRLPQDGRATIRVGRREIDLRIASLPTSHSERIVIRLLDKSARLYRLDELGMGAAVLARFRQLIQIDHGLLLVTGPTGSGKSTTLYASLLEVNTAELNVLSVEDPIEYQLDGVSQTPINEKKGLTFAAGLRSVLRQDPDIIMVGEIRDPETASMAVQASLTGHLVFSTLHTNDAASAVTRLLDLGIEPYLVSSSLVAVLAQRLVRRICRDCAVVDDRPDTLEWLRQWDQSPLGPTDHPLRGAGCEKCRHTGFRGRLGIFELLTVTDAVRDLVQSRSTAASVRQLATQSGMELLRTDGLQKVHEGHTTVDEVIRASGTVEDF